jgi:hypothetical protein
MRYLSFISLFFGLLTACSSPEKIAKSEEPAISFWTSELMDNVNKNDFRLLLSTPQANITGVFIVKQVDGEWRGTIINEFGLKILDFVSTPKEGKVMNVIPFIDKWYIKKTLAADIQFMMEIDNPAYRLGAKASRHWDKDTLVVNYKKEKELQRFPNGEIQYTNHKRALTYSLKKIYETER